MSTEAELMARLHHEADHCYAWSNGPGDRYPSHAHSYEKLLYCVRGSITFVLEAEGRSLELGPGDRLVLPAGTVHSAWVGPHGVACIEGQRARSGPAASGAVKMARDEHHRVHP